MHILNDAAKDCFRSFRQDVSGIEVPERLNFPFYYEAHQLCRIAAEEVQDFLQQDLGHDFGLSETEGTPIGKMFGILVVRRGPQLGYLAAYSGKLANSNDVAFFVPPVFDMLQSDGYFLKKEEELNELNRQIETLEDDDVFVKLQSDFKQHTEHALSEIAHFKSEMKLRKDARKLQRTQSRSLLKPEEFAVLESGLVRESLYDKHLLKTLTEELKSTEIQIVEKINYFKETIESLKEQRKKGSNALQQWLFRNYTFLNNLKEEKSLLQIFESSLHGVPPAGAGECCAPKLFQYAFLHDLEPIALAEFWWGASPKSEVRRHGQFYPSCWGKCEPILGHMLKGIEMDENPFLNNPAEGKDLPIVYDDPYLVIVNKPAEFLSVPGIHIADSVYERIRNRYPQATGPLIVHRLDMSTSGIMVLAKNKEVHENLQKQFIKRKVRKTYMALLDGIVTPDKGRIELPLRVDLDDRPRQMVCYKYGKPAVTDFEVLSVNDTATRIRFMPVTGRTHQLRVHAAHELGLRAPIKGDDLYGNKAERLHLHAHRLSFYHPVTGEWVTFEVEPDF